MVCCAGLLKSLCCIGILGAAAAIAWRFGPWYNSSESDNSTFAALNACDGCCNGLQSNCAKPIDQVTFPMVHNAHSSKADYFLAYNNNKNMEEALIAGYRGLMLDSCICDGSIGEYVQEIFNGEDNGEAYLGFCHKSCDAGVRNPAQLLSNINSFLEVNENEVLILEFEINDDSLTNLFGAIEDSGLGKYVHVPSTFNSDNYEWPTMQTLIDANERLLLLAHGGEMQSCQTDKCPDILYKYDYIQQTNWNDDTCDIMGNSKEDRGFFMMNHWMNNDASGLPSPSNAAEFNTYESLRKRYERCDDDGGDGKRLPNIIAVDFWDVGDVLDFVRDVNEGKV